ncbi:MAG TPA: hypothetical protein VGP57_14490 [Actinoplanes sp.]|nr:hypothetical protein [Actinoplanes sp.]
MTRVRVDMDALAEWSRTLDRLPPLAEQLPAVGPPATPAELPAAMTLHRISATGMLALAEVVESFDRLTEQLRSAAATAVAEYSLVDDRAASIVDSCVR